MYIDRADSINIKFENGFEEQWTLDQYKSHKDVAQIRIGDVGYKFVEPFKINGTIELFNGTVMSIRDARRRECKYNDSAKKYIRSLDRIKELSILQRADLEDTESIEGIEKESDTESYEEELQ